MPYKMANLARPEWENLDNELKIALEKHHRALSQNPTSEGWIPKVGNDITQ